MIDFQVSLFIEALQVVYILFGSTAFALMLLGRSFDYGMLII